MEYNDLMKEISDDILWDTTNDENKYLVDKVTFINIKDENPMVNRPSHYTSGSQEVIDIIEEAIQNAPTVTDGFLQGQVLKYILRMWLKDNPQQDAEKAEWYLERLIKSLRHCN